ncbi:MAG: hypothetical protein ACSLE2_17880, partial [Lysobacterales bacterium]
MEVQVLSWAPDSNNNNEKWGRKKGAGYNFAKHVADLAAFQRTKLYPAPFFRPLTVARKTPHAPPT